MQIINYDISGKQISDLKSYVKAVLGIEYYDRVGKFYDFVANSRARYRVILTRKCFNLLNTYYWCSKRGDRTNDITFGSLFQSRDMLISSIPQIASEYVLFNKMPDILLIEDSIFHGQTINDFLDHFITELTKYLNEHGIDESREEVEDNVLRFLTVKIMAQTSTPLLLKRPYFNRLELLGGGSSILAPLVKHDLSFRTSRLVSENIFSNTMRLFSAYEVDADFISHRAVEMGFIESAWNKRDVRNVWVRPLYRADGNIVAIYAVCLNQNRVDKQFTVTPIVMTADFSIDCVQELYSSVDAVMPDIPEKIRGVSNLIPFMLSYDLLMLFFQGSDIIKIDKDKIFGNANKNSDTWDAGVSMLTQTEPFLTMEQLESLILKATENADPLICINHTGQPVNELIANEGEHYEIEIYQQYNSWRPMTGAVKHHIRDLFSKVDISTEEMLVNSVGDVFRSINAGYITMDFQAGNNAVSCLYVINERVLFIHPMQYQNCFSVLCEIERDCLDNKEKMLERIRKMYGNDVALCDELCDYVTMLYDSGQFVHDWNVNYCSTVEVDFEKYPELRDRSRDDRIELQMILNSMERMKSVDQYRKLYPDLKQSGSRF